MAKFWGLFPGKNLLHANVACDLSRNILLLRMFSLTFDAPFLLDAP